MDVKVSLKQKTRNHFGRLVARLIRSDLEPAGRGLLKALRLYWRDRPVHVDRPPKTRPSLPAGPAISNRGAQAGDLLLWVPRGLDSRLIDDVTGGYGYSHVTVDCGDVDLPTGKPVVIETTVGQKVREKFLDEYGARPFARIPLRKAGVIPDEFCKCVKSKLGQPYDNLEALTWGEVDDPAKQICSSLATVCLPEEIRQDIAEKYRLGVLRRKSVSARTLPSKHGLREFVSPNGLAEYFGAPKGKELKGPDQLVSPHIVQAPVLPIPPVVRNNPWKTALITAAAACITWWIWQKKQTADGHAINSSSR